MAHSSLVQLLTRCRKIMKGKHQLFTYIAHQAEEMGFYLGNTNFRQAMDILSGKKTTCRLKEEGYRRWCWSDSDILSDFKRYLLCMAVSEKKIMVTMDFLVNKMRWKSGEIAAEVPYVLNYSLEKRMCLVVRVLVSKGLIEEDSLSLGNVVKMPEQNFLSSCVTIYLDSVPELLKVYQGKLDVHKLTYLWADRCHISEALPEMNDLFSLPSLDQKQVFHTL